MGRASLGDFDVATIDENSPSESNLLLFLFGVTAVQFILFSMFFSILGEAQAVIIERNRNASLDEFSKMLDVTEGLDDMQAGVQEGLDDIHAGLQTGLSRISFGMFGKKDVADCTKVVPAEAISERKPSAAAIIAGEGVP